MSVQATDSQFIFSPAAIPSLTIAGSSALVPVHRVYCVGRNYAAHAVEMGRDPNKELPFFFQKNPDNLVTNGEFPYPPVSNDVHHEAELAVVLNGGGQDIPLSAALGFVYGYGIALDMTRRDLQAKAKEAGQPWEAAKAFEASAPISPIAAASEIGHPVRGAIWLDVNGARRQTGDLSQMIWKVPEVVAYLSSLFTLRAGDVILTGTPSGVSSVARGDRLHAHIDGIGDLEVRVV